MNDLLKERFKNSAFALARDASDFRLLVDMDDWAEALTVLRKLESDVSDLRFEMEYCLLEDEENEDH